MLRRSASDQIVRISNQKAVSSALGQWCGQLCCCQQLRQNSSLGQALRRQRQQTQEPGPSHPQQSPLSQQSHQAAESKDWQANRPPHPHIKFSNQPNAAKRPRKPVHWVLPGEVQASPSDQPKQVNGAGRQAAAVHDPWLLGEEPTHRQPVTGRKRLSWAQPSPPSNAPTNSRTAVQAKWQPRPQASRPPNGSQLSTAQSKNDDMRPGHANMQPWKSLQPPAQSRRSGQVSPEVAAERARRQAQAVPPSREQYLRNQAQMQKQIALHELKKRMQEQEQGQGVAAASPYTELRADLKRKPAPVAQAVPQVPAEVVIPPDVTVQQLAQLLGLQATQELERVLADVGDPPSSLEDRLPMDSAELAVMEFGRVAVISKEAQEVDADARPRPAVVTVMGHVDHGKTSLLDALRKTSVAAGEAGGITQHIGAFEVKMPDSQQSLTFLDTPGHAAFSAMRARGAAVTDLVVLVAAADDGVMPQTREAVAHCKAAGCPIVVALTKCDVPMAQPARVRQQLIAEGLELEEIGGSIQVVETAAPKGKGLLDLEEALMLQAEGLELKASPSRPAEAVVVEAKLDKGQGPVATAIVKKGSLEVGQFVVVGSQWGKVRSLRSAAGANIKKAMPGQPVEIAGLKGVPQAGDHLQVLPTEERAKRVSDARHERADKWRQEREKQVVMHQLQQQQERADAEAAAAADGNEEAADRQPSSLDALPEERNLVVIIKADVQGSVEAVRQSVLALADSEVGVKVVSEGVGPVTTTDVDTARASGACIMAFNVKFANAAVEGVAKVQAVQVVQHRVIYRMLEEVNHMMAERAPMVAEEKIVGQANVLQVFDVKSKQAAAVAGCRVSEGSVQSGLQWRVMRGGKSVHQGACNSIKRHKLQVHQVGKGTECGIMLTDFADFHLGDTLQCISVEMVPSKQRANS
ncbi:TPA: hypothetical protein ACH3X2_003998 [Trebouxia sp. C0005]|nr:MAG: hypothetical protein FRX49_00161 [Trebouxia sp. A1-2]